MQASSELMADAATMFRRILLNPYVIPFFISFYLVVDYIIPIPSLVTGSGDAHSIWQTIISFRDDSIESSYVLYKGFLSVYPYVWFYELSVYLEQDHFLFIKLYHALLFAFVAAIGVPYVVSRILRIDLKLYKNIVLVLVLFYTFKFTLIFNAMMVDLPSWAFFVAAICLAMLSGYYTHTKKIFVLLACGIFVGLTLSASGQYSLAGYLLIIYVVVSIFRRAGVQDHHRARYLAMCFLVFIAAIAIPKVYDSYFEATIVQPMRDRGEWLPSGKEWLVSGMTRLMPHYKYGYPGVSNRGLAILKETEGENFSERYERIKLGGGAYSASEYLRMIGSHPVDFGVMWATKTMIAISFDGVSVGERGARVSHLLIAYTALFICLYLIFLRCARIRDLTRENSLILLSIVSTIAAPVFLFIDMRYIIALQGFILGFAIHQEDVLRNVRDYLAQSKPENNRTAIARLSNLPVPYPAILYVIFLVACFTLYGALLEIPGSDPAEVLYRW